MNSDKPPPPGEKPSPSRQGRPSRPRPSPPPHRLLPMAEAHRRLPKRSRQSTAATASNPRRAGVNGESAKPGEGSARLPPPPVSSSPIGMLGLGGSPNPRGINLNMTPDSVVAVVGQDKLNQERIADGERRKSAHRGSWQASNFERWRAAIENYVSSVKPGNQTALNTARSPFATYLTTIHNRIHPLFAEDFFGSRSTAFLPTIP